MISNKRRFGLIGYPLKHSFSPGYFAKKFKSEDIQDAEYSLYELSQIGDFEKLINAGLIGLNVTIPYKEKVMQYLDDLSSEAQEIQAVNTIKFHDGKLIGYNTDCYGFELSLKGLYGKNKPKNALILGTGGASKAVAYTLKNLGIGYTFVSRQSQFLNYEEIDQDRLANNKLIVNTTPLGTWPDVDTKPNLPYNYITEEHFLYDLVYNPEKTVFLSLGEKRGASIKNGFDMLKLQAEKSWEIWNT